VTHTKKSFLHLKNRFLSQKQKIRKICKNKFVCLKDSWKFREKFNLDDFLFDTVFVWTPADVAAWRNKSKILLSIICCCSIFCQISLYNFQIQKSKSWIQTILFFISLIHSTTLLSFCPKKLPITLPEPKLCTSTGYRFSFSFILRHDFFFHIAQKNKIK
jgi:hypothetical protein